MWICEKCGKENSGKFCVFCGAAKPETMRDTQTTASFDGGVTVKYKNNIYNETNDEENENRIENKTENKNVNQKKMKKRYIVLIAIGLIIVVSFGGIFGYYASAKSDLKNGRYTRAEEKFENIKFFLNSKQMVKECIYQEAVSLMQDKKYTEALEKLEAIADYEKTQQTIDECKYLLLEEYKKNNDYKSATELISTMGKVKKGDRLYEIQLWCNYSYAQSIMETDIFKARELLESIKDDYEQAEDLILECTYKIAKQYESDGEYEKAVEEFEKCGEYKDSGYLLNSLKAMATQKAYEAYENADYTRCGKLLDLAQNAPSADIEKIEAYRLFLAYKTEDDAKRDNQELYSYLTDYPQARAIVLENEDVFYDFICGEWYENGTKMFEISAEYELVNAYSPRMSNGKIKYSTGRVFSKDGKAFLYDIEIVSENEIKAKTDFDLSEHIFNRQ